MIGPARTAAFHALRAIAASRADLPSVLVRSRQQLDDERDRHLTAEIVTGTLRWQRTLDVLIERIADRPLGKIDPDVITILRLSLYQLLHLDRVPASAVVDDGVSLTRRARRAGAAGFVNAVLRSTLRQRHRLPLPGRPDADAARADWIDYLGVTLSHPEWLVARWVDRYGIDATEHWLRFNNSTPGMTLRANTLRATRDEVAAAVSQHGVETEPARFAPDGLYVRSGNPLRQPAEGLFLVQDEASQLVSLTVAAEPGQRVLDVCASPGGKTVAMAADMTDTGMVIACDVRWRRMELLRQTVAASGASSIREVQLPTSGALPFAPAFDRVLVDAPCSGLGTLRRDPDIKWRRREAELQALSADQRALLSRAADVVRPGGWLVYATCSSEPEENDGIVDGFLASHDEFETIDLRVVASDALSPVLDDRGRLRTLPFVHGLDAFFAAVMRRR